MRNRVQVFGVQGRHEDGAYIGRGFALIAIPAAAINGDVDAGTQKLRGEFLDMALDPAKNGGNAFLSDHDDFHSL